MPTACAVISFFTTAAPSMAPTSRDTGLPILYLSYDSQTSDTGLDTRLEAFYDMLAMKKEKTI